MNNRRKLIITLSATLFTPGGVLAIAIVPASAQAQKPTPRCVGYMGTNPDSAEPMRLAFLDGMRANGYSEGKNICYEFRAHQGIPARMEQQARELVAAKVAVIVVTNTPSALAAQKATTDIPVVFFTVGDPLSAGLVRSLASPGGNITGFSLLNEGLRAKRIEILHQIAPERKRIGVLFNPLQAKIYESTIPDVEAGAKAYGKELLWVPAGTLQEFDAAFAKLEAWRPDALMLMEGGLFYIHRKALLERAARYGWPSIAGDKSFAEAGAFVSYGADYVDIARRSAGYVARILKGAKPAELPVQQPVKFDLVINMKVAKAIGLEVPRQVLLLADHVIN